MTKALRELAQDLAEYLNQNVLEEDTISIEDVLDSLASLGITLVEDPVGDSSMTYFETLDDRRSQHGPSET